MGQVRFTMKPYTQVTNITAGDGTRATGTSGTATSNTAIGAEQLEAETRLMALETVEINGKHSHYGMR